MTALQNNNVTLFLKKLSEDTTIPVIQLSDYLCDKNECITMIDDSFLYRDNKHLSVIGSVKLANHIQLFDLIKANAK